MDPNTEQRARALHEWYCNQTGQKLPLRMDLLQRWMEWITLGHSGPELRKVIIYLRKQINAGKRNDGSLKLSNILRVDQFEEDLGLATMSKSGFLDPEKRIAKPPDMTP